MFGIPGGAILPAYDPIFDSKVRHILVRHEQGAGHAATGYAQATGKVGVCIATSGPGATNLVTPIADAYMDSVAMVAITGQVPAASIGTDAFQEADIHGITLPITKHNYLVQTAEDLPRILAEAFHLAGTGRPGPVLVDIPKDVLQAQTEFAWPPTLELPGYRPTLQPHGKQIREAARLIAWPAARCSTSAAACSRPHASEVLQQAGRADRRAGGHHADGPGRVPGLPPAAHGHARHARHGRRGLRAAEGRPAGRARRPLRRPGHRPAGHASPRARQIVHADIDPAEIGKNRAADVPIVGDAQHVIEELIAARGGRAQGRAPGRPDRLVAPARRHPRPLPAGLGGAAGRHPRPAVRDQAARRDRRARTRSTSPASASTRCGPRSSSRTRTRRTWLNSGGLGTMGYAVPAAMGAKVGRPDTVVWAIDGDGCFQMTNQELATCALEGIPIKVAIINNGNLGMVRQWQTLFYDERYSNTDLGTHKHRIPDFVKLAEALGCIGLRCESRGRRGRDDRGRDEDQRRARWWSTSWSARTRWCGRWSPPAPATTRSCSPATCGRRSTTTTCE